MGDHFRPGWRRCAALSGLLLTACAALGYPVDTLHKDEASWRKLESSFPPTVVAAAKSVAYLTFAPGQVTLSIFAPDGHALEFKKGWEDSLGFIGETRDSGFDASGECVVLAAKGGPIGKARNEVSLPKLAAALNAAGIQTPVLLDTDPGDLSFVTFATPTKAEKHDQAFGMLVTSNSPPADVIGSARGTRGSFLVLYLFVALLLLPWAYVRTAGRRRPELTSGVVQAKYDRSLGYMVKLALSSLMVIGLAALADFNHVAETWLLLTHGASPWPFVLVIFGTYPVAFSLAVQRIKRQPDETRTSSEIGRRVLHQSARIAVIIEFSVLFIALVSFALNQTDATALVLSFGVILMLMTLAISALSKPVKVHLAEVCPRFTELAARADVKVQSALVSEARVANAFALSRNRLVVTRGCIDILEADELEAIIAHELGHFKFKDCQRRALARGIILAVGTGLAAGLWTVVGLDPSNPGFLAGTALVLLCLVRPLVMNVTSRHEEYRADRLAADLTSPSALARALVKIHNANRMALRLNQLDEATMSHPSVSRRLKALGQSMLAA